MIRKLLSALILAAVPGMACAQTIEHLGVASQFNNWRAYGSVNLVAGVNPLVTVSPCAFAAGGANFPALAALTPIKIVDPNNPAIDEVLTPTGIVGCTAAFTTANAHPMPWYITSGSCGLGEALNNAAQSGVLNTVELDSYYHIAGCGPVTAYNAPGNANLALVDVTLAPNPAFRWNGTHYVNNYTSPNGAFSGSNPGIAAGAAAGTSPTVSNVVGSTTNMPQASVATGTATTTGTLFTETYAASSFLTAANCTVQSVGANTPPAFTFAVTYVSNQAIVTVSVLTAPPVSTTYLFNLSCS